MAKITVIAAIGLLTGSALGQPADDCQSAANITACRQGKVALAQKAFIDSIQRETDLENRTLEQLKANSAPYRAGLRAAENIVRSAGFTCSEALKVWHPELAPAGLIAVVCVSKPSQKKYLFHVRDYGGRLIVSAGPS